MVGVVICCEDDFNSQALGELVKVECKVNKDYRKIVENNILNWKTQEKLDFSK